MKRTLFIVLAAVFLVCVPGTALAESNGQADTISGDIVIRPMYTYIDFANCSLNITANGCAQMTPWFICGAPANKLRISEYLQRNNGGTWQTVASWSQYYYSTSADWSQDYYVEHGFQYRLYCYFYAYQGSTLLESTTLADYYNFY